MTTAPAGTVLADAELLDVHGQVTTLSAALGSGPAVLVFYRGAWCPYCNVALSTYQAHLLPELTARGVRLVAISPQAPDGSLSMQEEHQLAFAVLSDPGNVVAGRLGILAEGVDADGPATLPMPTTVVVDADRTVRWIDVHPDYTTRSEPADVLAAVTRAGL